MAGINNSYDIYNNTFSTDAPIVNSIVSDILTQLEINVAANVQQFDYSLATYLPNTVPLPQSNRIIDRVLCILRDAGIRAYVNNTPSNPGPDNDTFQPGFTPWFNNNVPYNNIHVTWFSRNTQEYMKTYC